MFCVEVHNIICFQNIRETEFSIFPILLKVTSCKLKLRFHIFCRPNHCRVTYFLFFLNLFTIFRRIISQKKRVKISSKLHFLFLRYLRLRMMGGWKSLFSPRYSPVRIGSIFLLLVAHGFMRTCKSLYILPIFDYYIFFQF